MLIRTEKNRIFFSNTLLGTPEAWLWVGTGYGPRDNNDKRVQETRALMETYYPYVPYGMWVGNQKAGTQVPLTDVDGWYMADVSWWPEGTYRLNLHTLAGVSSPIGSPLKPENRDQECSWAPLDAAPWGSEEHTSLIPYLHTEENGSGMSLRILIRPDRSIEPFGDV